jgi:hypothetical protein
MAQIVGVRVILPGRRVPMTPTIVDHWPHCWEHAVPKKITLPKKKKITKKIVLYNHLKKKKKNVPRKIFGKSGKRKTENGSNTNNEQDEFRCV